MLAAEPRLDAANQSERLLGATLTDQVRRRSGHLELRVVSLVQRNSRSSAAPPAHPLLSQDNENPHNHVCQRNKQVSIVLYRAQALAAEPQPDAASQPERLLGDTVTIQVRPRSDHLELCNTMTPHFNRLRLAE